MQTLYTYQGHNGPEFVIRYKPGRSYRCYYLTDPDLYSECNLAHELDDLPYHTYTPLLTADHITLDLLKSELPEYFI